ncbi:MAG: hypothetical protein GX649_19395 [Chloroflexi bacterium]|nr:hypothetical protein [Chloroflexota bacterium]
MKGWCTLVAGYPKAGKTELVVRLCHAWKEERILYVTEEPESIWCARLAGLPDGWGHVTLLFGLGVEPAVLREEIRASGATVVVIDTVAGWVGQSSVTDPNSGTGCRPSSGRCRIPCTPSPSWTWSAAQWSG